MWKGITPEPDPGFVRKLKTFDPKLKCKFSRKLGKFVITQPTRLRSGEAVAAVVEGDTGGGYRQPDERDLGVLARADFERKSHKERIREGEEFVEKNREAEEKREHETFRDVAKDNYNQLRHYYANLTGDRADDHNPAFRRVKTKPKGELKDTGKGFQIVDKRRV